MTETVSGPPTGGAVATPRATVAVVQGYLDDLARGDVAAARARFGEDLVYVAPGRNRLAGTGRGPGAAGDWYGRMAELSGGTYAVVDTLDRLASGTSAVLIVREHAVVAGHEHTWTRAVVLDLAAGLIERVQLFEDDQYAYDAWLGAEPGGAAAPAPDDGDRPGGSSGPPEMSGDLDDPRVRAVLSYQRQVAAGDVESARRVFWPDVTYVVPGRGLLAGTHRGPDAVMGYFADLFRLTDGSYAISRMHWTTSPDRVALRTRNSATRNGRSLTWDELIVFTFVDGRKKSIMHFSGDQYGVDLLFS